MDFYITAYFLGTDGTHGYTHEDQYELSIHYGTDGAIKIYECPDGQDWDFPNLYTFLQSWSEVTLKD